MENDKFKTSIQDFYVYLKEPIPFDQLSDDRVVLNHPIVKNFKSACMKEPTWILKSIEFIAKNIQTLDTYKVGISCKLICGLIDLSNPAPFVSSFIIGVFIRILVLVDKYIYKSLNFIETQEIILSAPDEFRAWKSLDSVIEAATIILSSSISTRDKFRENKNYGVLINRLKTYIKPLESIFNIYKLTDNEELIVIEPQKLLGFKFIINGIQNNYHLFTLLQYELAEKASHLLNISPNKNKDALEIAKGIKKFDIHRNIPVQALFSFFTWKSFTQSVQSKVPLSSQPLIKGSDKPHTLPRFESTKIIIISQPQKSLIQWDSIEFKPINQYLSSETKLTEFLNKNMVSDILRKILS